MNTLCTLYKSGVFHTRLSVLWTQEPCAVDCKEWLKIPPNPGCTPHLKQGFAAPSKKRWSIALQLLASRLDIWLPLIECSRCNIQRAPSPGCRSLVISAFTLLGIRPACKKPKLASLRMSNHMEREANTNIQHVGEAILDCPASVQPPTATTTSNPRWS